MNFVGKVISLLFNRLSRLVIAFLLRTKGLLILLLQSPYALILKPKKIKSVTVSIISTFIFPEVMESDAMILGFRIVNLSQLETATGWKRNFTSSTLGIGHLPLGPAMSGIFVEKHESNGYIQEPKESSKVMLLVGPSLSL